MARTARVQRPGRTARRLGVGVGDRPRRRLRGLREREAFYFRSDSTYPTSDSEAACSLASGGDPSHGATTFATVPAHGYSNGTERGGLATVSQNSAFHLPAGGTITYTCGTAASATKDASATQQYANMRVTAVQVATLH